MGSDAPQTFDKGTTQVTWTVTDVHGNTASTIQNVTVKDTELPTITAPPDVTVSTDPGLCSASIANLGSPSASDNCPGVSSSATRSDGETLGAPFPKGETVVTWTAVDSSGNSSSANQKVTVNDNEAPTITAPGAVTVSTDPGKCEASNVSLGTPVTADNCEVASVTNDAQPPFHKGTTVVTWTVTDTSGNKAKATQNVNVVDTESPKITCPSDKVFGTNSGCTYALSAGRAELGAATATDNCEIASVTNDAPAAFPKGDTMVTWTATDTSGLTSICKQKVTVVDTTAPVISGGTASPTSLWPPNHKLVAIGLAATGSDNCDSTVSLVLDSATSNEADNGLGDGDTANDIQIVNGTLYLRAERSGLGSGRIYTITLRVKDSAGNVSTNTKVVTVTVPKSQGK